MNGYYELLDVPVDATKKEIRRAYVGYAKLNHPDKGGDIEQFRMYTQIYETLIDDSKRVAYDATPEGLSHLGKIEVENLKRVMPKALWGEFLDQQKREAPVYKYYAFARDDELASRWYDVLIAVHQALRVDTVIRLSLEDASPTIKHYPHQPGIMVIPTGIKPNFFIGFHIVSSLLTSENVSARGIIDEKHGKPQHGLGLIRKKTNNGI